MIVGASLAGLRAAEALRDEGFRGPLTIIGDEPHEPYDRPPLSKQVLTGWVAAAVRAWAVDMGFEVSDRGRIPAPVLDAYRNRDAAAPPTEAQGRG